MVRLAALWCWCSFAVACTNDPPSAIDAGTAVPPGTTIVPPQPDEQARTASADPAPPSVPAAALPVAEETPPSADDLAEAERLAFEAAYPLHGVTFHFLAQVFAGPSTSETVIGYMRRGARFRATERIGTRGCAAGWHEVVGGGFVCRGAGYQLGSTPQSFEPSPAPPALDDALPYAYAYTTRDDVPQYWRIPTPDEERAAHDAIGLARAEAAQAAEPTPDTEAPTADVVGEPAAEVDAPPPPGQEVEHAEEESDAADTFPDYLRMAMLRGFYVSVDREELSPETRRFYRTVRGGFVSADALVANTPPGSGGVILGGAWQLPLAIVYRQGVSVFRRRPADGSLREIGPIDRHRALIVADDDLAIGDRRYVVSTDGDLVREPAVRIVRRRERPGGVPTGARWIAVDLSDQTLTAYEGDEPIFATLVSTGKPGFETPTGLYRIQSKHVSTTMDDDQNPEGAYSIEDVPWTMYFHGNYALHGAFWHYSFGRVRSHGCVNLAPADARWLFRWTTPTLPPDWHGVFATERDPATYVFIEE